MKAKTLLFISFFLFAFGMNAAYGQWTVYDCGVTPDQADPVWEKGSTTPGTTDGSEPVLCTVVDDAAITGNKLLKVERLEGVNRESWKTTVGGGFTDASIGATVVWRVKPTEGLIAIAADDGKEYMYSYMSVRNGAFQEETKYNFPGILNADRADITFSIPGTDWYIFRMTLINDALNIYLNEDPFPIITGTTPKTTSNTIVRFGINNTTPEFQGQLYDWIVWDSTGAYAPGEGTALPSELT